MFRYAFSSCDLQLERGPKIKWIDADARHLWRHRDGQLRLRRKSGRRSLRFLCRCGRRVVQVLLFVRSRGCESTATCVYVPCTAKVGGCQQGGLCKQWKRSSMSMVRGNNQVKLIPDGQLERREMAIRESTSRLVG